jgi:hypothetical protein
VLDGAAVRAAAPDLLAASDRLAALDRPIAPRGVLLFERLLEYADGALSERVLAAAVRDEIRHAGAALELP